MCSVATVVRWLPSTGLATKRIQYSAKLIAKKSKIPRVAKNEKKKVRTFCGKYFGAFGIFYGELYLADIFN